MRETAVCERGALHQNAQCLMWCVCCLVAARTRLRKMVAEEVSKKGAAANDADKPVERSPHAKEVRQNMRGTFSSVSCN